MESGLWSGFAAAAPGEGGNAPWALEGLEIGKAGKRKHSTFPVPPIFTLSSLCLKTESLY